MPEDIRLRHYRYASQSGTSLHVPTRPDVDTTVQVLSVTPFGGQEVMWDYVTIETPHHRHESA